MATAPAQAMDTRPRSRRSTPESFENAALSEQRTIPTTAQIDQTRKATIPIIRKTWEVKICPIETKPTTKTM